MAQLKNSIFTGKLHGSIGSIMFRSMNGKTFLSLRRGYEDIDYWSELQSVIGSLNLIEHAYKIEKRKLRKMMKNVIENENNIKKPKKNAETNNGNNDEPFESVIL